MKLLFKYLPLALLMGLLAVLWLAWERHLHPVEMQQKVIPFPDFNVVDIRNPKQKITQEDLKGKISLVHVWASWCSVCVQEHDVWKNIAQQYDYPVIGMVYRDAPADFLAILKEKGDFYHYLINDFSGNIGLKLGLMGTPETYIIDQAGLIRFHYLGGITPTLFKEHFLPVISQLEQNQHVE